MASVTMAKKKKKHKQGKKPARMPARPPGRTVARAIEQARDLLRRGRVDAAVGLLQETDRTHPGEPELLMLLTEIGMRTQQSHVLLDAAVKLARARPDDPAVCGLLGAAYMHCNFSLLGLRTFRELLANWPNHPNSALARQNVADIERTVAERLADLAGDRPDAEELVLAHEQMQVELQRMRFGEAQRRAEELLRRWPDFIPALNNLAEACFHDGLLAQALIAARQAVERAPDNTHAAANLTRLLVLSGHMDEARSMGERLRQMPVQRPDNYPKVAEAISFLGDDQAVIDTWRHSASQREGMSPDSVALLLHLAAVAFFRQGDEDRAGLLWRECLQIAPGFSLATQNLEDLERPVGERHAPWAYTLQYWLPRRTFEQLVARTSSPGMSEQRMRQEFRLFFGQHPEIVALVPLLLDRGDPDGRQTAFLLAGVARTPELLVALRDFALGQRGPDRLRVDAASIASQAKLLPPGKARMWMKGRWSDVQMMGWEISGEPRPQQKHTPAVERLVVQGVNALHANNGKRAEELFRQALALEPDTPDLANNLAGALAMQGRTAEGEQMLQDLHARFPDYLFAAVQLASLAAQRGQVEQAEQLIEPFTRRHELHVSEFRAIAGAQVQLCLARKDPEGAGHWLRMLEKVAPDDPNLPYLRSCVHGGRPGRR